MDDMSRQTDTHMTTINQQTLRWFEACAKCQHDIVQEITRFATARMQHNLRWMTEGANSPTSFIELQGRWMRDAMEDYVAEMHRLTKLTSEALQQQTRQVTELADELDKPVAIRPNR
jgi:hypothetical protein